MDAVKIVYAIIAITVGILVVSSVLLPTVTEASEDYASYASLFGIVGIMVIIAIVMIAVRLMGGRE